MNKDDFIEMLNNAREDEYGRLYVIGNYDNRIYFGTITTICEDIFNLTSDKTTEEIYDRHFWNDDTLECHVVSTKHDKNIEYKEPKRIEKIKTIGCNVEVKIGNKKTTIPTESLLNDIVISKINELIESFNRYECLIEKSEENVNTTN